MAAHDSREEKLKMHSLVSETLEELESTDERVVSEALVVLAEVIGVNCINGFESCFPEAQDAKLDRAELLELKAALMSWVERHPNHPHVSTAFWALGKLFDESMIPFFKHWMRRYVDQAIASIHPVGQISIALGNLGERVISKSSFSSREYGKNLEDAIEYLRSHEAA